MERLEGSSALSPEFEVQFVGQEAKQASNGLQVKERLDAAASHASGITAMPATLVRLSFASELHPQGYVIEWDGETLSVSYSEAAGLHYAIVTLEQLLARQGLEWEHFRIEDEPDFPVRGVMLDIGRNKIPQMETILTLIDRLSEVKINHLQLYMEGFCFDYTAYKDSFPEATPISAAEFRELDAYAKARFIDLVPNQNGLGHMGPWLAKPEFAGLAEHPGGQPTPVSITLPPMTLNPTDGRSIELVKTMLDELLPNFTSDYVNINMDEPFGLGTGQSKERADEVGLGKLYFDYAAKVFDIVQSHGKRTLMWGDIVTKHEEIIPLLPNNVTVLDWNYESHISFEAHCKQLRESGVSFYVCPGTSSWSAITGRTDNMLANIADAAKNGKAYGAGGLVVTDWGDSGHWQPMAMSYPGFVYAAGAGWQVEANVEKIDQMEQYVTQSLLRDNGGGIGKLLLELGRYYHLENSTLENMTYTSYLLNRGLSTREKLETETALLVKLLVEIGGSGTPFKLDYSYDEMQEWLKQREEELSRVSLNLPDAEIVVRELANAIRLIDHGAGLHRYIFRIELPDAEAEILWLKKLKAELTMIIEQFNKLWLSRNRQGGMEASNKNLYKLLRQYEERLCELETNE
jgi:hypothetical protein